MKPIKNINLTEETKKYISKYIKTLELKKNNKLPREEKLAEMLGVSRVTVRAALNDLASEGIIFRKQGKGTFVNLEALEMKVTFNPVLQFKDMIINSGYSPGVELLGIENIKANKGIGEILEVKEGTDIIRAKKMFYADKNPCAYCVDYFSKDLFENPKYFNDLSKYEDSIFRFIYEKTGKSVSWDRVEILTTTCTKDGELRKLFDCNSSMSFLLLKGINFDKDDMPLVYANEYIDTDFIKFNLIRQRYINY